MATHFQPLILSGPIEGPDGRRWQVNGNVPVPGFLGLQDCRLADVYSEAYAALVVEAPALHRLTREFLTTGSTPGLVAQLRALHARIDAVASRA